MLDRRLALMQLSDSFFPSGSFTLSHGLESLVATGQVRSSEDFQDFLTLLLYNRVGSCDLVALFHAYRASATQNLAAVQQIDHRLFAQTLVQEAREAQQKSGKALLMVAQTTWADVQLEWLLDQSEAGHLHCLHPIVFAVVGRVAGLTESDVAFAFLHSFVTGLAGAAIRLGILGHIRSQIVLRTIAADIEAVIDHAADQALDTMWSCTPAIDLAQMSHRRLMVKQFAS
ncbi:urease accessory protein UreF [Leptolyngbya sp. FACHB-36]|uniref:urease accessory protein UreF n=1 Tax=Leptolyngbya sp. FACHB-36 TaxID=2692808 RepID=UPI001680788B|nr:urease accessory UreF family protein [Leptolyngbya sp. FACHB-36]MBD2018988.1 urease accessory protein UreF [Leptolyngbya sp. FACHB-36]